MHFENISVDLLMGRDVVHVGRMTKTASSCMAVLAYFISVGMVSNVLKY